MGKYLLGIMLLVVFWQPDLYAQKPVVKVEQYMVIVKRDFFKKQYGIVAWENKSVPCFVNGQNTTITGCQPISDPTAANASGKPKLDIYISNGSGGSVLYKSIVPANFITMNGGDTLHYIDTFFIYQSQFSITKISSSAITNRYPTPPEAGGSFNCGVLDCSLTQKRDFVSQADIFPTGNFFEQTTQGNLNDVFGVITKVTVQPNLDVSYNLPSHDQILIKGVINNNPDLTINGTWLYSVPSQPNVYLPIPVQPTGTDKSKLYVSGVDIFGPVNYKNYLHKTINIRMRNSATGDTSLPVPFTLKLSSPHIQSVTTQNVNCFDEPNGSLKITFDRALLPSEKLNIFAVDTATQLNYSAFNLTDLDNTNSYTWDNELRAGSYFITLIGKYANNLPYDIDVFTRDTSIKKYEALNSITFQDGFNATDALVNEDFTAYPDYTSYAQTTYTGSIRHTYYPFPVITQPQKLNVGIRVDSNVLCKGTSAGVITIAAEGGFNFPNNKRFYKYSLKHNDSTNYRPFVNFDNSTPGFVSFANNPFTSTQAVSQKIRGLAAGTYQMLLRDSVDCFVRDSIGNELTYSFTITEPEKGITVDQLEVSPITSADSANGSFSIKISGGTQYNTVVNGGETVYDEAYVVELRDSATNTLLQDRVRYTDTTITGVYSMQTGKLNEGVYILKVFDKSYKANDPYNTGCYLELHLPFAKPKPLIVDITKRKQVSCFSSQDGELVATASGGIQNDTTRYQYKWFQLTGEGNVALPTVTDTLIKVADSVLSGIKTGTYRVEITDKYNNKKSDTFFLSQPANMQLHFITTPASCYTSFDGTMGVTVTGGTPFADPLNSYAYEWSNGSLKSFVDSVAGGTYLLVVRDSMGCIAKDTVAVSTPVRVIAKDTMLHAVTCYNSSDGSFSVSAVGGTGIYTYLWSNNSTTATVTGLKPGTYWYTVTDQNGCYDSDTLTLAQPDTILVNLGPDRLLCKGQTLKINATVPNAATPLTYVWTGTGSYVSDGGRASITGSGTYTLAVSNTTGCTIKDTIVVTTSADSVNTDFIVSTQSYKNETTVLVNLSYPSTQDSVLWIMPSFGTGVTLQSYSNLNAQVLFADTGRYELGMKVYYHNGCIDDTSKFVNVIARDNLGNLGNQGNAYLKLYAVVVPNPNHGTFDVNLTFSEPTRARMRLINTLTNITVDARDITVPSTSVFTEHYNLDSMIAAGIYVLVIDTPKGSFVLKIVKQ